MKNGFNKRIFSIASFRLALAELFSQMDRVKTAVRSGRVDKAFSERIMLAVTQVNGCRYCEYGHARWALEAGVSRAEVEALLAGEFDEMPPQEIPALLFAQHYAETEGRPSRQAWRRLVETYGVETAQDILVYIRMIMMGNLAGNTLDAFLSRLRGRPAAGSSVWQELGVLVGGPLMIPAGFIRHRWLRSP